MFRARRIAPVDPLGPSFLSYRRSDGTELAGSLAWTLRATGIPVWRDTDDLPPGETRTRLEEALTERLSGGVLLVTPEVEKSEIIRELEAPRLLRLHEDHGFSLCVASALPRDEAGGVDRDGPDRVLGTTANRRLRRHQSPGPLKRVKQYAVPDDQGELARDLARQRMRAVRDRGEETLSIHVQTRAAPIANGVRSGLVVRTRPPEAGARLPHREAWEPLRVLLTNLPQLVEESGAEVVRFRGGGHLSIGLALGTALPTTSDAHVEVEDHDGHHWRITLGSREELAPDVIREGADGPVDVAVDLAPTDPPVDTFIEHVDSAPSGTAAMRLRKVGHLDPASGGELVRLAAEEIRAWASAHATTEVHLFLRVPFPIAVLLGRMMNTLRVTAYEWDDTVNPPRYVPTLTLSPGHGGGPVTCVHI